MGNSESQYSIQGSRSNSFIIPGRQKPYSFKGHSAKEDILSPLGFWNAGSGYSGLKPRNIGRSSSPSKSNRTFMSRQYDYITHKLKSGANSQWNGVSEDLLPGGCLTLPSENGCLYGSHKEKGNPSYAVNTMKTLEKSSRLAEMEDQSSPRVVIKKDGSVRVEFNNSSNSSLILDDCTGPVQLLKFSPTLESNSCVSGVTPSLEAHFGAPQAVASFKSSKGSSLSSDGSLYDLPWGTSVELHDSDNGSPNSQSISTKVGFLAEQLPAITTADLYRDPRFAATFPTVKDLQFSNNSHLKHRSSFVSVMEELGSEGGPEEKQYSSFTLPSQKTKPFLDNNGKKVSIRNRFRRISDWTGSLTRKKWKFQEPRYNEPVDCFDSGVDGLTADTSSPSQVSSFLTVPHGMPQTRSHSLSLNTRSGSAGALHLGTDVLRQNIYKNFMRELKTGRPPAEGGREDWRESSSEETESSSQEVLGGLEQLDLLFEKEKGVVRRAGWLSFKPLLTVHKDRKLELVGRRKWKQFWVTLKGCTMLFYETYGKASSDPESPCYALLAEDGVVQAVPEHPKKENVFCLSNAYGDVYLFQASNQTDLENWVTAIHSASASLFAKRYGKEDTLRLLRGQIHGLLQKIDMDSKMRKMAELQLSIVGDPKNRKAIENQIQQWEQNLERFNMDLFRMRCYLASLQGGELPNPKSLLATVSRPTKAALARLGIFSVSSFHALICSRDEATMRKRSLSLSHRGCSKKGVFSSLKGLDTLTKRGHEKKPSVSQVLHPLCLRPGDEIMVLNGCEVSSLDLALIQTLFNDQSLQLTVKRHPPSIQHSTDTANTHVDTVCSLYHSFQDGSGLMEGQEQTGPEAPTLRPCPRHMSATERLRKVIQELVDTEKSYVKDLNCLFEIYLKPLQKETFLTQDEMESLFGSLPEMLEFQKVFLQTLEEKISLFPNFNTLETPLQFKKLLFSLGGSFLYYAEHFKLYSGFCANHIKVQKVLERAKTDRSFKEFLDARNPTKQHSTTLESYLIKPVQRVLKYPLLLRELVSLTDTDSEEHYHLTEALKEMEKVASHINEMQKIYEDYGAVFDQLVADQSGTEKEVTEISMGQFLVHSSVIWLNPFPSLGRMKKDPELNVFVFKRAVILLYRENNKVKKKMPTSKSAHGEQDPFKFRWLIPLSALQVRLGNTADTDCIWELIHTKSQKEGRPETVFQLCSSTPECKVNIIKVIRSILRENLRRNMQRVEQQPERTYKKRLTPLRKTLPTSAKLGSSRPFLLSKQPSNDSSNPNNDLLGLSLPDSDSASVSSGTTSSASTPLDQLSRHAQSGLRESNIISDNETNDQEWRDCPSAIEAQFCRLRLTEEASQAPAPHVLPESGEVDTPERQCSIKRAHFSAVKRKPGRGTSSFRRSQAALLNMRRHSHSLDSQTETMANSVDLNSLLEKEFSVQSLTSVVNEDFFYDNTAEAKNVTTS
uniref:T-lymphoma invasion and metastasis-inducing protein 2-like n=1 Tax=Sinocyclocheilus anshuiensis TaxID=1608454 RepID=A0A671RRS1_9TELE